ncbi:hypothetical protein BESB_070770 [Besnoitia besnoiti]|uniref:RRM domain-containing protein n=1 Tax=Besnoitia besnoiti TaxID=94643 RepID=A0A2A9M7F8_BESBE|nr:uncharacterized protein BESB_070770 [Besnoitia besnoiti]PFH33925.1 hypothetical protein BESB_070770 [Besnoitia besnoiti]
MATSLPTNSRPPVWDYPCAPPPYRQQSLPPFSIVSSFSLGTRSAPLSQAFSASSPSVSSPPSTPLVILPYPYSPLYPAYPAVLGYECVGGGPLPTQGIRPFPQGWQPQAMPHYAPVICGASPRAGSLAFSLHPVPAYSPFSLAPPQRPASSFHPVELVGAQGLQTETASRPLPETASYSVKRSPTHTEDTPPSIDAASRSGVAHVASPGRALEQTDLRRLGFHSEGGQSGHLEDAPHEDLADEEVEEHGGRGEGARGEEEGSDHCGGAHGGAGGVWGDAGTQGEARSHARDEAERRELTKCPSSVLPPQHPAMTSTSSAERGNERRCPKSPVLRVTGVPADLPLWDLHRFFSSCTEGEGILDICPESAGVVWVKFFSERGARLAAEKLSGLAVVPPADASPCGAHERYHARPPSAAAASVSPPSAASAEACRPWTARHPRLSRDLLPPRSSLSPSVSSSPWSSSSSQSHQSGCSSPSFSSFWSPASPSLASFYPRASPSLGPLGFPQSPANSGFHRNAPKPREKSFGGRPPYRHRPRGAGGDGAEGTQPTVGDLRSFVQPESYAPTAVYAADFTAE